jgi:hypothetical protein
MIEAMRATRRDDLVDLISCIDLELPAKTLGVRPAVRAMPGGAR